MKTRKALALGAELTFFILLLMVVVGGNTARADDLDTVREAGVLRHLGVPYANFVTGDGDGLDVEIAQGFAEHLGVRYEFVQTTWRNTFGDLTGQHVAVVDGTATAADTTAIRGDLIGHGMTVLPWRRQFLNFSEPVFPTSVWLIARAETAMSPIKPSGDIAQDILAAKQSLEGHSVLGVGGTCVDPALYALEATGARIQMAERVVESYLLIPMMLKGEADSTLLDATGVMTSMDRYPGSIKIIGPISPPQEMAFAFRKTAPKLRQAFNEYLARLHRDGSYMRLVEKYYPSAPYYYPEFFAARTPEASK